MPDNQLIITLQVDESCTVEQAIFQSGILQEFSQIDLSKNKVGIFTEICSLNKILQENDRIEIYRHLVMDPMEARRQRAIKQKQ